MPSAVQGAFGAGAHERLQGVDGHGGAVFAGEEGGKRSVEHLVAARMACDAREVAISLGQHGPAGSAAAAIRVSNAAAEPASQATRQLCLLAAAGAN